MSRKTLFASLILSLFTPAIAFTTPAHAAGGDHVVINEAYLRGGSSGATYLNKYVELYNPTDSAVSLLGWSLQYRSATGIANPTGIVALTKSIPAKGYYLIEGNANSTAGVDWDDSVTPDDTTEVSWSGSSGTLVLANQSTAVNPGTGSIIGNDAVVDLLGYNSSNTFETAAASGAPGLTTALARTGGTDTDSNAADFAHVGDFVPTNSSGISYGTEPPAPPVAKTIAEIQGPSDASPLSGQTVTTTGFVTARYATGGFNGYVIQSAGSGTEIDNTSDGLFVYSTATVGEVALGDFIEVTGAVSEYKGLTELTVPAGGVTKLDATGLQPPTPAKVAWPATDVGREALESMLIAPQGNFTVTDTYDTNYYASIGLAAGTKPLLIPTEIAQPSSSAYLEALADNAARAVTLDDGSSINFNSAANKSIALPYLSLAKPIRVGAATTFTGPVILDYRNGLWSFQPLEQLTVANAATVQPADFANTRTTAPEGAGGRVKIASFNVLNYFTTTGEDAVSLGATCTYYRDRDANPITVNSCDNPGVRGAANAANLTRQQAKIVAAINALDADVVSLEEIENSTIAGKPRDAAVSALVAALNAAAGSTRWAFAASPSAVPAGEDVIRTAFLFNPEKVEAVGDSDISTDAAFEDARPALAQAFRPIGEGQNVFVAIVNHFKSKGCASPGPDPATDPNADQGDGQGCWNALRVTQANAVLAFADQLKTSKGTDKVFLMGDFNAYTQEDPLQRLYAAGYVDQGTKTGKYTYSFDGQSGSLDHILASPAADKLVSGTDIWNINSAESIALEYSRFNYNLTNFYDASPYRSSDHDPVLVGYSPPSPVPAAKTTTRLRLSRSQVRFGTTVTASATVSGADTGIVRFSYDGVNVDVALTNGRANLVLPNDLALGTHWVRAAFLGTSSALPSNAKPQRLVVIRTKVGVINKSEHWQIRNHEPFIFTVSTRPLAAGLWVTGTLRTSINGRLVSRESLTSADKGTKVITIDSRALSGLRKGHVYVVVTELIDSPQVHHAIVKQGALTLR